MTYDEWELGQDISPSSPESYYAELAWKAAISEARKIALDCEGADDKVGLLIHTELEALL